MTRRDRFADWLEAEVERQRVLTRRQHALSTLVGVPLGYAMFIPAMWGLESIGLVEPSLSVPLVLLSAPFVLVFAFVATFLGGAVAVRVLK